MRKNILIFGHGYASGFIEATNQYIQLFDKTQYDITVVYLDGEKNEEIIKKHLTNNIIFLNTSKKTKRGLKIQTIQTMLKLHREKKFQIVICHRYKPTYVMLWVSQFYSIPALFAIMHEMNTIHSISRKLSMALLTSKKVVFAGVSNAVRDDIRKNIWGVSKEQVITLYNMIDMQQTEVEFLPKDEARKQLGIANSDFVFGILSRLAKAKDHSTLLKGFALAKLHCKTAKLLIIGDGELAATLQAQINSLHLTNDVIMTGFLPNALSVLKALDVFVLSSTKEAFGRVLLEAMTAKLPLLTTNANGIPEVVGESGIVVEKQNPDQLAEKMRQYYDMSTTERITWSQKSYQRVLSTFSIEHFKKFFWQLPLLNHGFL